MGNEKKKIFRFSRLQSSNIVRLELYPYFAAPDKLTNFKQNSKKLRSFRLQICKMYEWYQQFVKFSTVENFFSWLAFSHGILRLRSPSKCCSVKKVVESFRGTFQASLPTWFVNLQPSTSVLEMSGVGERILIVAIAHFNSRCSPSLKGVYNLHH